MSQSIALAGYAIISVLAGLGGLEVAGRLIYGKHAVWWNPVRRYVWPRIHDQLKEISGYSLSHVTKRQWVGRMELDEGELEDALISVGFQRNPWAALKRRNKRQDISEGSWVWRKSKRSGVPDFLASMQLHVTVFERKDGAGYDVYAHWEDNYWVKPRKHLDGANFSQSKGVEMMREKLTDGKVSFDPDVEPDPMLEQEAGDTK